MIEVRQTLEFSSWLRRLKDDNAARGSLAAFGEWSREIQATLEASARA